MTGTLTRTTGSAVALQDAAARAQDFIGASTAPGTRQVYARNWRHFQRWCASYGLPALPATPEIVAVYVAELAETLKPATLGLRLTAISQAHQAAGHESPTHAAAVRKTMAGIRRTKGTAQDAKAPLTVADLRCIVAEHLRPDIRGTRDRALLLLGFAGAFRRSELVGLNVEDLERVPEGFVVTLRRSKTDQEGIGRKIGIPFGDHAATCPVRAMEAWLAQSGIAVGAIFRPVDRWDAVTAERLGGHAVAVIVKHYAVAIGRDPAVFAGHSLRAGFCTAAAGAGALERDIMRQSGHRSTAMLRRYIRDGSLFRANAAGAVGL